MTVIRWNGTEEEIVTSMRLGVAGPPMPRNADGITAELGRQLAAWGVTTVAVNLEDPPEQIAGRAAEVRKILDDNGITIAQSTGYRPNLVHPDTAVRKEGHRRLTYALEVGAALGAVMVNTGCGSVSLTAQYGPHRDNHRTETRDRLVESLIRICTVADELGLLLSLECHILTTLSDPDTIRSIFDTVDSDSLRINFDPVNLIGTIDDVFDTTGSLQRMGAVLGPTYGPSAHVKDVTARDQLVVHLDEVAPGEGEMDWDAYFAICRNLEEGSALIVEHLPAGQMERSLEVVTELATSRGITLTE